MMRFILIMFLIVYTGVHVAATELMPSGEGMRTAFREKNSEEKERRKKEKKISGYLRADYLVYLVMISSGAYILIRRKSKNIHL
ncbi:hypothetical protein JGH11_06460 [Dysgonomonas sp. Marseille-P4677]|uniref:hypothetical protein n=1 Tax=Dysgonomonas sp. Marseille-P4677 TaxID=2364790 RepID=UPI001911940E|nr:hypothetical protein [Dysgonomonas sp. Marseille-P4677]MBK5720509.1 hypothetical protein [Dysgonomonas sp. Marseille-P4677]